MVDNPTIIEKKFDDVRLWLRGSRRDIYTVTCEVRTGVIHKRQGLPFRKIEWFPWHPESVRYVHFTQRTFQI